MIYLEMSRDETHGGGTWAFSNCVWSPSRTQNGRRWAFWEKLLSVKAGDSILHLRGVGKDAKFVGFSRASGDGFETSQAPPEPKEWSHSRSFYRADLSDFVAFHSPVSLQTVFQDRERELIEYFEQNRIRGRHKRNLFYVRQSGRLQCLNGAYLSDVDADLLDALFGKSTTENPRGSDNSTVSVETGVQIANLKTRQGQAEFSDRIKKAYGYQCCFPGCELNDPRFLVGSHIARWADCPALRGVLGNGLCLCLIHDKAFEFGIFTLDENFRVYVNPKEPLIGASFARELFKYHGHQISLSSIRPLSDALLEHWVRVGIDPLEANHH